MTKPKPNPISVDSAVELIGFGRFQLALVAVCGTVQAADAMEIMLLSFLGRSVQCQWRLTSSQIAWLATCVFIGSTFGAPILGAISDRYGRWNALLLSACIIAYYGALSAASPSFAWILVMRFFVGFAVAGLIPVSTTLTGEFLPARFRASFIIATMGFWTIGSLFEVFVAWLCLGADGDLEPDGWRRMLAMTALPLFLTMPLFAWLPRSPRFLLASGKPEEALRQLNRVARTNGQPELTGPLTDPAVKAARGSLSGLFGNPELIRLTLLLFVSWLGCGFLYYGAVLLSTELPSRPHRCLQNWSHQLSKPEAGKSNGDCCQTLSSSDYGLAAFATLGEFFSYLSVVLFVDTCGRKAVMAVNTGILCVLLVCLQFCMPTKLLAVLMFFVRSCASSAIFTIYIYTNEAYPTTIRTLGMGVHCAASRIGALLSPFVAQILLSDYSVLAGLLTYSGVAALTTVAIVLLPFETKGRPLRQTFEETVTGSTNAAEPTEGDGLTNGNSKGYESLSATGSAGVSDAGDEARLQTNNS